MNEVQAVINEQITKSVAEGLKVKSPSDYKNDKTGMPQDIKPETKARFMEWYELYAKKHMTMLDIAREYEVNVNYVNRAIKWIVTRNGEADSKVYKAVIEDKLLHALQDLDNTLDKAKVNVDFEKILSWLTNAIYYIQGEEIDKAVGKIEEVRHYILENKSKNVRDEILVRGEIRKTIQMLAQAQNVLHSSSNGIPQNTKINILFPNLNRGQGVDSVEVVSESC
jgi:hypothetical protein